MWPTVKRSIRSFLFAADLFRHSAFARRAPAVGGAHDLVRALEAERLGNSRGRRVVPLRVHIHLGCIALLGEHWREAQYVAWQLGLASRRALRLAERRLARALEDALPRLGHDAGRNLAGGLEARRLRQLATIEEK